VFIMNSHLRLVSSSIFSPRAAVDLARQQPNPFWLALIYLAVLCVAESVVGIAIPSLVSPLEPNVPIVIDPPFLFDDPVVIGVFNVVFLVFCFFAARWYWRKLTPVEVSQAAIDAAIAVIFASWLAILLPEAIISRLIENSAGTVIATEILLYLIISLSLETIYISHATGISIARSFWLNVFFTFLVVLIALAVMLALQSYVWATFPWNTRAA
jgi:hypothetical protein